MNGRLRKYLSRAGLAVSIVCAVALVSDRMAPILAVLMIAGLLAWVLLG